MPAKLKSSIRYLTIASRDFEVQFCEFEVNDADVDFKFEFKVKVRFLDLVKATCFNLQGSTSLLLRVW